MLTSQSLYEEFNAAKQQKRKDNRDSSPSVLENYGIEYESKNSGAHLVVTGTRGLIDFWPGTGKWIARAGGSGRGVFELADAIMRGQL